MNHTNENNFVLCYINKTIKKNVIKEDQIAFKVDSLQVPFFYVHVFDRLLELSEYLFLPVVIYLPSCGYKTCLHFFLWYLEDKEKSLFIYLFVVPHTG